ncbi:very short patch repair endonuclease [Knoellia sp. 3-2P3]|uniref:very short patch repair endonuclease n=1 Tax=unclassified Knoellia TaxID=2618719 RepID=UPI0023DA51A1|nr:very short patch repair endonuclease [Knoellia sp. 3-2P3]MDF2092583.1 very short patch repair endonuclease [Knoellia sp. 3-2P3]
MAPTDARFSRHMSTYPRGETAPEMHIRRLLHASGLRYRIHYPVPGRPRRKIDIAFPKARVAVFVDGCYWHACPQHGTMPKSNTEWWQWKLSANTSRDEDTNRVLAEAGWRVMRFWEHESPEQVATAVTRAVRDAP